MKGEKSRRMRTTIILEWESQEDFEKALDIGVQCASERFIGIRFSLPERDEHGPIVEVRTTRARRGKK
jgi:hypothetical protein